MWVASVLSECMTSVSEIREQIGRAFEAVRAFESANELNAIADACAVAPSRFPVPLCRTVENVRGRGGGGSGQEKLTVPVEEFMLCHVDTQTAVTVWDWDPQSRFISRAEA